MEIVLFAAHVRYLELNLTSHSYKRQPSSHSHIVEGDRAGSELLYVFFLVKGDGWCIRLKSGCIYWAANSMTRGFHTKKETELPAWVSVDPNHKPQIQSHSKADHSFSVGATVESRLKAQWELSCSEGDILWEWKCFSFCIRIKIKDDFTQEKPESARHTNLMANSKQRAPWQVHMKQNASWGRQNGVFLLFLISVLILIQHFLTN